MPNDLLETLQADVHGVLSSVPGLADAKIIADNEGDIESRVIKSLAPISAGTTNKSGLSIVVLLPEVTESEANLPGPPFTVRLEIQVIEAVMVNRGTTGTNVRSSQAAMEVLHALHHHHLGHLLLVSDRDPIQPLPTKAGHVSHVVRLVARANGLQSPASVRGITPAIAEDIITLTTPTGGAAIYYTTDGSYPAASNSAATLYGDPFAAPAVGTTVRAVATATGLNPSDLLEFTITD